jgi:hypothetical protein
MTDLTPTVPHRASSSFFKYVLDPLLSPLIKSSPARIDQRRRYHHWMRARIVVSCSVVRTE